VTKHTGYSNQAVDIVIQMSKATPRHFCSHGISFHVSTDVNVSQSFTAASTSFTTAT